MKVGDLVKPSLDWHQHAWADEEDFGIGVLLERVIDTTGKLQYRVAWSASGAGLSWEYDYELEVINEGR